MEKREARVAGSFYPGDAEALRHALEGFIEPDRDKAEAIALVSPHAGYMYSGTVAGAVFSSVRLPERYVLLGPSHSGFGERFAIWSRGSWCTPLGEISIDEPLADLLLSETALLREDHDAHREEHSLEVQLPFIQYLRPGSRMVPISCPYFSVFADLEELGRALASVFRALGDRVLIVASTDMSHQVSRETAKTKDFMAIDAIRALDPRGLYDVVSRERISMCGFQATTAALAAAVNLGASRAELIRYRTSGDITGDHTRVVGYAGLRIA